MARKTFQHTGFDAKGRPVVSETASTRLPRHLRGYDPEFDVHTFTEGPLKRLFGRKH